MPQLSVTSSIAKVALSKDDLKPTVGRPQKHSLNVYNSKILWGSMPPDPPSTDIILSLSAKVAPLPPTLTNHSPPLVVLG